MNSRVLFYSLDPFWGQSILFFLIRPSFCTFKFLLLFLSFLLSRFL